MKDTLSVRIRTAERRMALTLKAAKAADKPFVSFCCGDDLARRLGFRAADALVGVPLGDLFAADGDLAERIRLAWTGEPFVAEAAVGGVDCLVVVTPVRDSGGVFELIVSLAAEKEERPSGAPDRFDRRLHESLKAFLESSDFGFFYAENGRLLRCNGALLAMYGYSESELRYNGEIVELARAVGGLPASEPAVVKMRRKDGSVIHVECRGSRSMLDGREALLGIVRDVTDEIQTEQRLLHSEERYRSLLMYSPVPIVLHSDGILVYANEAAMKLTGAASSADLLGKPIFDFVPDERDRKLLQERIEWMEGGTSTSFSELRLVRKDGRPLDVEASSFNVASFFGKPLIQTVIVDVTERKRMERAIAEAETKYRTLVRSEERRVGKECRL